MRLEGNTVLITGGATGIGFAIAESFARSGSEVIVCSRTEHHLKEAKRKLPSLVTRRCNVADETERKDLYEWAVSLYPDLNVLVNNAGIQRMIDFRKGITDLHRFQMEDGEDEIEINLRALIYMTALFTPHLLQKEKAAIINVSSGLAFRPMAPMPVYCATKAAVHSFSQSLRDQLAGTPIKVYELIPPMVDTNLDKGARKDRGQTYFGMAVSDFIVPAIQGLKNDEAEIKVPDPNLPAGFGVQPGKPPV